MNDFFTWAHIQIFFSSLQASNNTGILNTCTRLWLTESEHATPVDSIKDIVQSSVKVPEFNKHLKKAGRHIGRNIDKDEDNSPKILNDKNHPTSSQKFRVCPCFSSSALHILFILLGWFLRWQVSGHTVVVFWGAASRI